MYSYNLPYPATTRIPSGGFHSPAYSSIYGNGFYPRPAGNQFSMGLPSATYTLPAPVNPLNNIRMPASGLSSSLPAQQMATITNKLTEANKRNRNEERATLLKLTGITGGLSFLMSGLYSGISAMTTQQLDRLFLIPPITMFGTFLGFLVGLVYNHFDR